MRLHRGSVHAQRAGPGEGAPGQPGKEWWGQLGLRVRAVIRSFGGSDRIRGADDEQKGKQNREGEAA